MDSDWLLKTKQKTKWGIPSWKWCLVLLYLLGRNLGWDWKLAQVPASWLGVWDGKGLYPNNIESLWWKYNSVPETLHLSCSQATIMSWYIIPYCRESGRWARAFEKRGLVHPGPETAAANSPSGAMRMRPTDAATYAATSAGSDQQKNSTAKPTSFSPKKSGLDPRKMWTCHLDSERYTIPCFIRDKTSTLCVHQRSVAIAR